MSLMASRFSEILFINLLDGRILVRFTDCLCSIIIIQYFRTDSLNIHSIADGSGYLRLTAAIDAAARTARGRNTLLLWCAGFYFF